jgi:hypothetical protein
MASHLHALGLPAPEGTLVVHFEYEVIVVWFVSAQF